MGQVKSEASVVNRTFHDVRGTAATLFAMAGTGVSEIAAMAGHSVGDLQGILDKTFLHRDERLWDAGVDKMDAMLSAMASVANDVAIGAGRETRQPNGVIGRKRQARGKDTEAA